MSRRERQAPGTGLNGPSPSGHQRKVMKKLLARIDSYDSAGTAKGSKTSTQGRRRPGSQNLKKRV